MNLPEYLRSDAYKTSLRTHDRATIVAGLSHVLYPRHQSIWINHADDYLNIETLLAKYCPEGQPAVIWQVEEDWFSDPRTPLETIRRRIRDCPLWKQDSFIITNSFDDWLQTRSFVRIEFKPALTDLIAYAPYDDGRGILPLNDIRLHTGFMYHHARAYREWLFNFLDGFPESRFSILKIGHGETLRTLGVRKNDPRIITDRPEFLNAPMTPLELDLPWVHDCAFGLEVETGDTYWSPTISEKVYRWVHFGRPCLVFGSAGARTYLKNLGFDTWDWLIDWSFDKPGDNRQRFMIFREEVRRMLRLPIEHLQALMVQHSAQLEANRTRLHQIIRDYDKIDFTAPYA